MFFRDQQLFAGIVLETPIMIVQEYASECLLDYVRRNKTKISVEVEMKFYAFQICSGMNYLVCKRYVHRDLALRNILMQDRYRIKVSDFGLSRAFNSSDYCYQASQGGSWPLKVINKQHF